MVIIKISALTSLTASGMVNCLSPTRIWRISEPSVSVAEDGTKMWDLSMPPLKKCDVVDSPTK